MSAESSAGSAGPILNLNSEEKRLYGQLFRQADTEGVGVVTGEVAVKFFDKTRLDSRVLGEIWQIADKENRGFLTPAGFGLVLRLIGHAQAGREPSYELGLQPAPLPRFDGFMPTGVSAPSQLAPPAPIQAQGTGGVATRIPPLTPDKVAQYAGLFDRQPLQGGNMLPGDQARSIFEKSGLPIEVLGRIWQLADTEQRGALVQTEFVIAMHLLTSMKTGAVRALPSVLPAALYEAATRRGSVTRQSPTTTGPPQSAMPRQLSGSAHMRANSPLVRSPLNPQFSGVAGHTTGSDWAITPADKATFDEYYNILDKENKGFITGEQAVPFLSRSNLPDEALAQVWDLADMTSTGRLTRDTFAVAMYLIRQQRSKRDGSALPTSLPLNLVPPSMRGQVATAGASPFDAPAPAPGQVPAPAAPQQPPAPKSALDDLFGLDAPNPPPFQASSSTGGSAAPRDPFAAASPAGPSSSVPTSPKGNNNKFKPFIPSSSFGRTLTTNDTGASTGSKSALGPSPVAQSNDLLGDGDGDASKNLGNEAVELANLSNQIGSLFNKMQQVQGQRASTEKELSQSSQQKKNFEDRLAQLRALYEKEAKEVSDLQNLLQQSREETRKLMSEMAGIDGTYRDVQTEHQQVAAALQADQQENASLKQRISATNTDISQLKAQLEKLKLEARQQKGMVAINKKQLSTTEGERDKLESERDKLKDEIGNTSSASWSAARVASPALSTTGANNPFFRRTDSADAAAVFASPPTTKAVGERSFDDIFGSSAAGASNTPPPPTTFGRQHTGASATSAGSFATPATSSPVNRQATLTADHLAAAAQLGQTHPRQPSPPLSHDGVADKQPAPANVASRLEPTVTGQSAASDAASPAMPPFSEVKANVTGSRALPGAFPDDEPPKTGAPFAGDRDSELFGDMKKDTVNVNAKDDFDSAFAAFAPTRSQDKTKDDDPALSVFSSEFPPISELERDDDSDSASEANGFEDNFATTLPPIKEKGKEAAAASSSPKATVEANTSAPSSHVIASFPTPPSLSRGTTSTPGHDPFAPASDLASAAQNSLDDLDAEFDGLEDAKEGSADDEFANISRSNIDTSNLVFDSPPPPPPPPPKRDGTTASTAFGPDSGFDFGLAPSTAAGAEALTNASKPSTAASAAPSNGWDDMFASLDEPGTNAAEAPFAKAGDEPGKPRPAQRADDRPGLGRGLTETGVHDDPILKNLTTMGYSRTDALNALEKYDYNLERAANYLAGQSEKI